MSEILELTTKIQETRAVIAQFERAVAENPEKPSLVASLTSLQRQMARLEAEFHAAAPRNFLEVIKYRVFDGIDEHVKPKLPAIVLPLITFQQLFSLVYDALKSGDPRRTAKISEEVSEKTTFGLEYSFAGSVGFVLTIPDNKTLIETDLQKAKNTIFEMVKVKNPEEVQDYAVKLGPAPLRLMYRWVKEHAEYKTGVEIDWQSDGEQSLNLLVQLPEFGALRDLIGAVGEETNEVVTRTGKLLGFDIAKKTFHMEFADDEEISGKVSEIITSQLSPDYQAKQPAMYRVTMTKRTVTKYIKEDDEVTWFLTGFTEEK